MKWKEPLAEGLIGGFVCEGVEESRGLVEVGENLVDHLIHQGASQTELHRHCCIISLIERVS